jgi:hypothetical protein
MKSRRMRWAGYAARVGKLEMVRGFWWRNLSEGVQLEDSDVDWRMVLE